MAEMLVEILDEIISTFWLASKLTIVFSKNFLNYDRETRCVKL